LKIEKLTLFRLFGVAIAEELFKKTQGKGILTGYQILCFLKAKKEKETENALSANYA
jgi:hypothetical protein